MKEILAQLSKRERKLLYFLLCFLIVFGAWYLLISPMLDKNTELNLEYQNTLLENSNKLIELEQHKNAPELLKEQKKIFNKLIKKYREVLTDEETEKLITTVILNNNMKPESLSLGELENVTIEDTEETSTQSEDSTQTNEITTSYLKQITVAVNVSGSTTQIVNTIEEFNQLDGVEITSFSYSTETEDDSATMSASINLVVYMTTPIE
jgi:hypothetical protein